MASSGQADCLDVCAGQVGRDGCERLRYIVFVMVLEKEVPPKILPDAGIRVPEVYLVWEPSPDGRMAQPGSGRATNAWLRTASATGGPLGIGFGALSDMAPCRASDHLLRHKKAPGDHMSGAVGTLLGLQPVVTLHDVTDTCFEGEVPGLPKARRGHLRERRPDAPLLTPGAVLDGGGFLRRTGILPGNVAGARALETMSASLGVPRGGTVVMDRGIATGESLAWMRARGYVYPVVSRGTTRVFDPGVETTMVSTASKGEVVVYPDPVEGREEDGTP